MDNLDNSTPRPIPKPRRTVAITNKPQPKIEYENVEIDNNLKQKLNPIKLIEKSTTYNDLMNELKNMQNAENDDDQIKRPVPAPRRTNEKINDETQKYTNVETSTIKSEKPLSPTTSTSSSKGAISKIRQANDIPDYVKNDTTKDINSKSQQNSSQTFQTTKESSTFYDSPELDRRNHINRKSFSGSTYSSNSTHSTDSSEHIPKYKTSSPRFVQIIFSFSIFMHLFFSYC